MKMATDTSSSESEAEGEIHLHGYAHGLEGYQFEPEGAYIVQLPPLYVL